MDIQKVNGSNQREPEPFIIFTSLKTNTAVDHSAKNTEQDHKSTISGYYFTTKQRRKCD